MRASDLTSCWARLARLAALLGCFVTSGAPVLADSGPGIRLSESQLEAAESRYGFAARLRLENWLEVIEEAKQEPEPEKLRLVNEFFNKTPWVSDMEHWKQEDYWATPVEVLLTNGADCEDFSIGKYFSLVAAGVDVNKLRITYVKANTPNPINQAHMVLTYYSTPDAVPLVLDNLIGEIQPATLRNDLTPVYSFNADGLWMARSRGEGKLSSSSDRLSLWNELTARMGKELQ